MPFFFKNHKAFSLVELTATIAIISILSIVGFSALQSTRSASRLKAAQREVAATIKLAQSYALQGMAQAGTTPCGYGFKFTSATNYQVYYNPGPTDCEKKNTGTDPVYQKNYLHYSAANSLSAETYSLKNNVNLSSALANAEIYFTVPHANSFDNAGNDYALQSSAFRTLTLTLSTVNKTVVINTGGSVTENP
jgi:prepilin-type N-terminal cleavage/methylation domain-containing protein